MQFKDAQIYAGGNFSNYFKQINGHTEICEIIYFTNYIAKDTRDKIA
jgi:hypothetical protein